MGDSTRSTRWQAGAKWRNRDASAFRLTCSNPPIASFHVLSASSSATMMRQKFSGFRLTCGVTCSSTGAKIAPRPCARDSLLCAATKCEAANSANTCSSDLLLASPSSVRPFRLVPHWQPLARRHSLPRPCYHRCAPRYHSSFTNGHFPRVLSRVAKAQDSHGWPCDLESARRPIAFGPRCAPENAYLESLKGIAWRSSSGQSTAAECNIRFVTASWLSQTGLGFIHRSPSKLLCRKPLLVNSIARIVASNPVQL